MLSSPREGRSRWAMGEFLGNTPTNITTTKSAVPSMHWSTAKKIGVHRKPGSEKNLPYRKSASRANAPT